MERSRRDGFEGLTDRDLLTLLVGGCSRASSVYGTADALLAEFTSLSNMARASVPSLARLGKLKPEQAARLAAAFEIGMRALRASPVFGRKILSPRDVADLVGPRLEHLGYEQVWVIALDHHSRYLGKRLVAQGGLHGCALRARDVLRMVLELNASSFVLVHNHPSGDPHPSAEDLALTRVIADSADMLGLPLVDHVIVGAMGCASFADLGLMKSSSLVPVSLPPLAPAPSLTPSLVQTS